MGEDSEGVGGKEGERGIVRWLHGERGKRVFFGREKETNCCVPPSLYTARRGERERERERERSD